MSSFPGYCTGRPTWRAQATHKFVSIDMTGVTQDPGSACARGDHHTDFTAPSEGVISYPTCLTYLWGLSQHPHIRSSPPTFRLASPSSGHLPLPVFSFSILL